MGAGLTPINAPMLIGGNTAAASFSTTSETSLFPAVAGTRTIPAGWFQPGYAARINLRGTVTVSILTPGTTTIRVKMNGATIASATMGSLLGLITSQNFQVLVNVQAFNTGSSGTLGVGGAITYPTGLAGLQSGQAVINATNVPFDSTVNNTIDCTVQHSLTGTSVMTTIATVELLPVVVP